MGEAQPLPAAWILAGQVHCGLSRSRHRLAELVAGHEQPLTEHRSCAVEVGLFRVRPVVAQPVAALPLLPFRLQHLE